MKFLLSLYLSLLGCSCLLAREHRIEEASVSLDLPDRWKVDETATYGYLVVDPTSENKLKIRIHRLSYKESGRKPQTPEEALRIGFERTNELRKKNSIPAETLLSSVAVTTGSGLRGQRGSIGPGPYLNRYYFQHPDPKVGFFCVCVYFMGRQTFADTCEKQILQTLAVLPAKKTT